MLSGHFFKQVRGQQTTPTADLKPGDEALLALLSQSVVERFDRMSDAGIHAVAVVLSETQDTDDPPFSPCHPACAEHATSDYCRESWQLHLAELKDKPETHWHKCDLGRLCALVPVIYRDQCLAVVKLACPASMTEDDFERQVELLDLLVSDFVSRQSGLLGNLPLHEHGVEDSGEAGPAGEPSVQEGSTPPQVLRALQHINQFLSDPKLTVARVAQELDIHPSYLSQLFSDHIGQRMSRFITSRRVELAKTMLATTDWQIKRIATETGHANPNWFCHVFSVHAGLTPGEYRRHLRGQGRSAPNP